MDANQQDDGGTPPETSPADDRPWRFKKGNPGRPGRGHRKGGSDEKPSQLLRDMRFVYGHDEGADRTAGHRHCREWLRSDKKGFLSKLADLEKAAGGSAKAGRPDAPAAPAEEDIGTEKCVQLCEELLKKWGADPAEGGAGA
jgi:hypothetical protein